MITSVGDLLEGAIRRHGVEEVVLSARVLEEADRVIEQLLGHEQAGYITPKAFSGGELRLAARVPAAAVEMRLRESELLERLRQKFPNVRFVRTQIDTSR